MTLVPGIPVQTASEHLRDFHARVSELRVPIAAHFELTYRCNFDCVHCYVVQPHATGELSTAEVKDVLDQLAGLGTLYLVLSGGEALVRPDFEELYLHAKRLGFLITLFTNGALLRERTLELLRDYPPLKVEVSLYGADEPAYAEVTRRRNMRDLVLGNVDRLQAAGLQVVLKTVALTVNVDELEGILAEAEARGCADEFKFDALITPRVDCRRGPTDYRVEAERVVATDRLLPSRGPDIRRLYLAAREVPPAAKVFRCGAGKNELTIDPYGRVTTCVLYRREYGDLRRQSLADIWERTIPAIVAQPATRATRCRTCDKYVVCGSCAGNNALDSGGADPEEPSDFQCQVAHARVDAFCADLRPTLPPPAGAVLPLHRRQECRRPWLAERRPVPAWFEPLPAANRQEAPPRGASGGPRRLPVLTAS